MHNPTTHSKTNKQTTLSTANLVKGECSINLLVGYILNRANFPSILIARNHHWRMDPQLIITQWPKISKIQNTENQDSEIKTKPKLTNQRIWKLENSPATHKNLHIDTFFFVILGAGIGIARSQISHRLIARPRSLWRR